MDWLATSIALLMEFGDLNGIGGQESHFIPQRICMNKGQMKGKNSLDINLTLALTP